MANPYYLSVVWPPERLELAGPLIPGWWSRHDDELGRHMPGEFLLDTGAYGSMIDAGVAEALQLVSRGAREVHGIHGDGSLPLYSARLAFSAKDAAGNDCVCERVVECVAVPSLTERSRDHGVEIVGILGRAFLRSARLQIDGAAGRVSLIIQP